MNKPVVVFPGRFQPPHIGHLNNYNVLVKKFGKGNVYIATSNKTDSGRSPLGFKQKEKLLTAMGIPKKQIIQVVRTYSSDEVFSTLGIEIDSAPYIVALGEKDAGRLGGKYFRPFKKGEDLLPAEEAGYVFSIPNTTIKASGKPMSATVIRGILKKDELDADDYKFLTTALGTKKKAIDKIKPLFECVQLLTEGGMGGHMSHVHEDQSLTFTEVEQIINDVLSGEINREEITEKVDGQNMFCSFIDDKVRLARNKGQISNRGAGSLDIKSIAERWKDAPAIAAAFTEGIKALEDAFVQMNSEDVNEIFGNGRNWVNMEIMWPASQNVIYYDTPRVIFHGLDIVDDAGAKVGIAAKAQKKLYTLIDKIKPGNVKVSKPIALKIKPRVDFADQVSVLVGKLDKFRKIQNVSKSATIRDWFHKMWMAKLTVIEKDKSIKIDKDVKSKIADRFADFNKSYTLPKIKKDLGDAVIYDAVKALDKQSTKIYKAEREPLELVMLQLGVEAMLNMDLLLQVNPDESLSNLRNNITKQIAKISKSKNVDDIEKMQKSLRQIEAIGGLDRLVPSEGLVFSYSGKLYKLTGLFAGINQLMGIGRFTR